MEGAVSVFKGAKNSNVVKHSMCFDVLLAIKRNDFKETIEELRAIRDIDEEQYAVAKQKLIAVTFSGTFKDKRAIANLITHSGLICLDVDKLTKEKLEAFKARLRDDAYTHSFFESPSGYGLKILIKISICKTQQEHEAHFRSLEQWYVERYNIELDPSGKDVSRLCFMSHDSEMYYNEDSYIWRSYGLSDGLKISNKTKELIPLHSPPEKGNRNNTLYKEACRLITKGLNEAEVLRMIYAQNDESESPLEYNEVATIINSAERYRKTEIPKDAVDIDELEVDFTREYKEPPKCIELVLKGAGRFHHHKFMRLSEMSIVKGWAGAKKSMLVNAIAAVASGGKHDLFEFKAHLHGKRGVVYIDTEQSAYDVSLVRKRVLDAGGKIENVKGYSLRRVNAKEKLSAVQQILNKHTDAALIILDNIADLVMNNNDPEQAKVMEAQLLQWLEQNGCHLMLVIHSNKSDEDDNATGHIGSALEKKAELSMKLTEVKNNQSLSDIKFTKNRGGIRPKGLVLEFMQDERIEIREI